MTETNEQLHSFRVLQINTVDIEGGAAKVALTSHEHCLAAGHDVYLAVNTALRQDYRIRALDNNRRGHPFWLVRGFFQRAFGWQDYSYPGSHRLNTLFPEGWDILHAHNLHGYYFDLGALPSLARQAPIVLTMHDMWAITGHCGYSMECEQWKIGCGQCPDLQRYPALRVDGTRFNWRRKQRLFQKSISWVTAPAQQLLDLLDDSLLAGIPRRLIPNGIDLDTYMTGTQTLRSEARRKLNLSDDAVVLLVVANPSNIYKDFDTLRKALDSLFKTHPAAHRLSLLVLGSANSNVVIDWGAAAGNVRLEPFTSTESEVAGYYHAADMLVHTAWAEVLPMTILEAMACGCAVVATAVGGIPEQVIPNETGLLVPPGDVSSLVEAIRTLIDDPERVRRMGQAARSLVESRFNMHDMVASYLDLYSEAIEAHRA